MTNHIDLKDFNSYIANLQEIMDGAKSVNYALCSEVDFVLKTFKQNKDLLQSCSQGVDALAETLLKKSVEDLRQYEGTGIIGSMRKVASCIKNMVALVFTNSGNYGHKVAQEFLGDRKYILQDPAIKMALISKIGSDGDFLFTPEALGKSDVELVSFIEGKLDGKVAFSVGVRDFFMTKLTSLKGEVHATNFAEQFGEKSSIEMRVRCLQSFLPEMTKGVFGQEQSFKVEENLAKTDSGVSSEGSLDSEEIVPEETSGQGVVQRSDEIESLYTLYGVMFPESGSLVKPSAQQEMSYFDAMMIYASYSEKG